MSTFYILVQWWFLYFFNVQNFCCYFDLLHTDVFLGFVCLLGWLVFVNRYYSWIDQWWTSIFSFLKMLHNKNLENDKGKSFKVKVQGPWTKKIEWNKKFIFCFFFKIEFVYSFSVCLSRCWIRNIFLHFLQIDFQFDIHHHQWSPWISIENQFSDRHTCCCCCLQWPLCPKKCLSILFSPCPRIEIYWKKWAPISVPKEKKRKLKFLWLNLVTNY